MIEAVNAVVSNAPLLRGNTEQSAVAVAANPGRVQEAASLPQAPYVSPYVFVDVNYDKAVLQIRDGDTGDVVRQFPSETALRVKSYGARRAQQTQAQTESQQAPSEPQVYTPGQETAAAAALEKGAQTAEPSSVTVVTSA